ncbi:MAG: BON domain-containing protein [Gemmatimonadota bacterium]
MSPAIRAAAETEARVRRALAEPGIAAITLRVSALTPRIVQLTGLVTSPDAAREAVRRARAVAAVDVVVDRLEVAS